MIIEENIIEAISKLNSAINNAENEFDTWTMTGNEWSNPTWEIENCYLKMMTIIEALKLGELHKLIYSEYGLYKQGRDGFGTHKMNPDGEPYSPCLSRLNLYLDTIQSFYPIENITKVNKDLLNIIRDIHYVITKKELYGGPPKEEKDVHIRIEGILKCLFADLKHKPTLTKSIKNFQPDTGISSLKTLIEYKFISQVSDAATIADEILADTRGYVSNDWKRFIYVIYETNRFKAEKEWNQLLKQSGVSDNTTAIVLSGEPIRKRKKK